MNNDWNKEKFEIVYNVSLTNKQVVKITIYICEIKFFKIIVNVIVNIVVCVYCLLIDYVDEFVFEIKYCLHNFINVVCFYNFVVCYKK